MMALNRYRLRHQAQAGRRAAKLAQALLARTDRLLGMVLIANTLINAAITALVTSVAISYFGNDEAVISVATGIVAFLIIVFSEITPKVIGATYPERIALPASYLLKPLQTLFHPVVWFVNLFVGMLLKLLRLNPSAGHEAQRLTPEELRSLVLEAEHFGRGKRRQVLLNLFELEDVRIEDVMVPRPQIEYIDLTHAIERIAEDIATCYHSVLPVCEGDINRVRGVLQVKKAIAPILAQELTHAQLEELLQEPYFVPLGTSVMQQLQAFQENRRRLGVVVDEYGEVQGLVTLADIIEELVGEFATGADRPAGHRADWDAQRHLVVDGTTLLRDLNRRLDLRFPLDGPSTLNGLLLETLQEIPEAPVCVALGCCRAEVLQIDHQTIRAVRLLKAAPEPTPFP